MSWYGTHSSFTKAQASKILPKGHCKHCNYWCRLILERDSLKYLAPESKCTRCGTVLNVLNILYAARRLGIISELKQIGG